MQQPEKKKRGPGRPFPPGVSGNPNGKLPMPAEVKEAKVFTASEIACGFAVVCSLTMTEIDALLERSDAKAIDQALARIMKNAVERGDPYHLDFFLKWMIGKPMNYSDDDTEEVRRMLEKIKGMPRDELLKRLNQAIVNGEKEIEVT